MWYRCIVVTYALVIQTAWIGIDNRIGARGMDDDWNAFVCICRQHLIVCIACGKLSLWCIFRFCVEAMFIGLHTTFSWGVRALSKSYIAVHYIFSMNRQSNRESQMKCFQGSAPPNLGSLVAPCHIMYSTLHGGGVDLRTNLINLKPIRIHHATRDNGSLLGTHGPWNKWYECTHLNRACVFSQQLY